MSAGSGRFAKIRRSVITHDLKDGSDLLVQVIVLFVAGAALDRFPKESACSSFEYGEFLANTPVVGRHGCDVMIRCEVR
jgi:hypothetical protein